MPNRRPAIASHLVSDDATMSGPRALAALAALGQSTRLDVFRLLMRNEPNGLSAGAIAASIGLQQNTLSTHLAILARAGLVRGTREGRSIVYRANVEGMRALIAFLVDDCCNGHPELCGLTSEDEAAAAARASDGARKCCD